MREMADLFLQQLNGTGLEEMAVFVQLVLLETFSVWLGMCTASWLPGVLLVGPWEEKGLSPLYKTNKRPPMPKTVFFNLKSSSPRSNRMESRCSGSSRYMEVRPSNRHEGGKKGGPGIHRSSACGVVGGLCISAVFEMGGPVLVFLFLFLVYIYMYRREGFFVFVCSIDFVGWKDVGNRQVGM